MALAGNIDLMFPQSLTLKSQCVQASVGGTDHIYAHLGP